MTQHYKREPLEEDEMFLLKQACKTFEESLIINVLLETGMRVSELAKLTKDQISWQRDCITTYGKGNKRRVIPVSSTTRFYLSEYFKEQAKIKYGERWIQKTVKRVAERAKLMKKVSPHVLRHTFAVCYLHKGGNVRALQGILGHSHIQTTDMYLNYSGIRVIDDFKRVWEQ
ncbi:tyrosine-type recombinase/integrase [Candidatus Woesearchaeota archaeon]|jgi:integrase/recombinase XerD|nr:tyrosine-type recombinase/integrase [Candidatus Woesearchaeota archaeon]MBT5397414.1 tyrosine-type recombinase/integrase [Candidatus Woesearchaeota archaeon]MBT5924237.1 tyrosine-type recombinase/integrase [Candidatus Woesearchaeota archaeon]MBT7762814.1 tyrosine-type recombinase/integrase [Candidatus Woesearchaeota archaeon]